jgi:1-acyl-sn-glycerol-3-phosphate acyltransferase
MPDTAVLGFKEMALRGGATWAQGAVQLLLSLVLRLFFRRIETAGASQIPRDEPLVFVLNHPNGLIDPALVFCALPRRISFLAKSTLFGMPVMGALLRAVEALPVYRRVDDAAEVGRNRLTFQKCRELLARGRCVAIFPEGRSHDETRLLPVKTGAARIALGALFTGRDEGDTSGGVGESSGEGGSTSAGASGLQTRGGEPPASEPAPRPLKIVPAGLYYTSKTRFRSEALIRFGPPLEVAPVEPDEDGEPPREAVRELSARIEEALRGVTLDVADDEELGVIARAEQLFSSLYETINFRLPLASEFELRRRLARTLARTPAPLPPRAERLRGRLREYEAELADFGVTPDNLSLLAHSRWEVFRHFLLASAMLLALSPLALVGALLHLPAYLLSTLFSLLFRRHGVDEIAPTVRILAAALFVPLTWIAVCAACYLYLGWRAALAALPACVLCGYVAVRSLEQLYDMRGWFKALWLLARRRRSVVRLLLDRRALHREMRALVGDLNS